MPRDGVTGAVSPIRRWGRAGLATLLLTVIAVFAVPAPSMAAGDDFYVDCSLSYTICQTGVEVPGPIGECLMASTRLGSTIVCVDYYGDYVYVKDNMSDGHSALAEIRNTGGSPYLRWCRNNHKAGSWARCNFNWREADDKNVLGGILLNERDMLRGQLWWFTGK